MMIDVPFSPPGQRPTSAVVASRGWNEAEKDAARMGHLIGRPEWDTEESLVGQCLRCELVLASDGTEAPYKFGPAMREPCHEGGQS